MELLNIRYFLALCEEQNFCQAAKRCGIAQPSLTNAIKRLERQIGGTLSYGSPALSQHHLRSCSNPTSSK